MSEVEFGHLGLFLAVDDLKVGAEGGDFCVACPFHDYVDGDAEVDGVADEGAAGAVG